MANAGYGNHETSDPKVAEGAAPEPASAKPSGGSHATATTPGDDDRRDQSTPGAGALPSKPPGGDVDPGVG